MARRFSSLADRTLATIAAFYDAALDETLWPQALERLTRLTDSQASSFWVLEAGRESRLSTFLSINFDRKVVEEYLGGMARLDPTVRHLLAHPRDSIVHDGMLGACRDEDSRNYFDWHLRSVETRFRLVGQASLAPRLQAGVALHRAPRAGRYESRDIDRFTLLHEHLSRALGIGARLGLLGTLRRLGEELLERSGAAVVLLDIAGRVVFVNRAAEALAAQTDGIRLAPDGIRLAREQDSEHLRSLIAASLDSLRLSGRASGGVMRSVRRSGRPPYGIEVTAISTWPSPLASLRPAVCVVITDPERRRGPSAEHLRALFKLTPAEARLAACLAEGESLQRAAERLEITYGTARSRLTQLFEKTGTRSQSALVRLLLTTLTWS